MMPLLALTLAPAACELAGGEVRKRGASENSTPSRHVARPEPGATAVLIGAGDIASCGSHDDDDDGRWNGGSGVELTARLLDSLVPGNAPVAVFTTGDNAYGEGTARQFASCYDPSWGRHKSVTRPAPGNHDYKTKGARGYFDYFGSNAGPGRRGYYSYDLGDWHIISLNSEISMARGSAQEEWLRDDLAATTKQCVLAYWHEPRFSSGKHGSSTVPAPLWEALYEHHAEIIVNGHDHHYERFAPQTPGGQRDEARGIRQFVVGTGGRKLRKFKSAIANSEVRYNATYGVLKLTLSADGYRWEFVSVSGAVPDSGSGTCR